MLAIAATLQLHVAYFNWVIDAHSIDHVLTSTLEPPGFLTASAARYSCALSPASLNY
jgi:hypothetical protein